MEKVISFVCENWKLIAYCITALVCFISCLVRKKPVKVIDSIYQEITDLVIRCIGLFERPGHGAEKKVSVLGCVQEWLADKHPEVDFQKYLDFASRIIEDILSTPQRKENNMKRYLPAKVNKRDFQKHGKRYAPKPITGKRLMRGGTRLV